MTECWWQTTPRSQYRDESWYLVDTAFTEGDPVVIDPFRIQNLIPLHCTFVQYHGDDNQIIEVCVPPRSDNNIRSLCAWFREEPGNYLFHEKYVTPQ